MPTRESHPIPNGTNNKQIVWPFAFANAEKLGRSKKTHKFYRNIIFFWLVLGTGRVTRGPAAASNHINFRKQVRRFVEVEMVIGRVEGVVASASRFTPG